MDNKISSKTAAAMLNVNESTIKRWADSSILKCIRTPGGHRKFTIEDIRNYAEKYNAEHPALTDRLYYLPVKSNSDHQNLRLYAERIEKNLLKGNSKAVYDLLFAFFINKNHPSIIFDKVVKKSFENITGKYNSNKLGIEDEHIASNTMFQALILFENSIAPEKSYDRKIICCSLENELHSIGLQCLKIALSYSGYECIFPGTNLPYKNLLNLIKETKAGVVCISTSVCEENPEIQKHFKSLEKLSVKNNFSLFIGGSNTNTRLLKNNVFNSSIEEMLKRLKQKYGKQK